MHRSQPTSDNERPGHREHRVWRPSHHSPTSTMADSAPAATPTRWCQLRRGRPSRPAARPPAGPTGIALHPGVGYDLNQVHQPAPRGPGSPAPRSRAHNRIVTSGEKARNHQRQRRHATAPSAARPLRGRNPDPAAENPGTPGANTAHAYYASAGPTLAAWPAVTAADSARTVAVQQCPAPSGQHRITATKEPTMHPAINYHLATALIADRHHQAERERAARAAKRATRAQQADPSHPATWRRARALTRHALTMLGARSG